MKKMVALFAASLSAVLFAEEPRLVLFKRETEKAAEDEAARIAAEEVRRAEIASWGNPVAAIFLAQSAVNFTPDERYGDSFAVNSVYRRNA